MEQWITSSAGRRWRITVPAADSRSWRACVSTGDLGPIQAGLRIGGKGPDERRPATLMPMTRTIRPATGRRWIVIGI